MAEGSGDFGFKDLDVDYRFDHNDDDEREVNRTKGFVSGMASTPYNRGEQIEMQTMQHEQSGLLETSYLETTPLLTSVTDGEIQ